MPAPIIWRIAAAAVCAPLAGSVAAAQLTFELRIEHGKVAETMRLVRIHQGDLVTLRWISDQPLTIHLHGYDIEQRVVPGSASDMVFTAGATGRFPIELHQPASGDRSASHGGAPLAILEVYPR